MKLKHRITGTILALVFTATSALPAAGIPQFKGPPAVKAAPVAPRVPVVKVPAVPKIPTVKVPNVPKIVRVPAAPKIPVVKVPNVPKIVRAPAAPKIPVVKVPGPAVTKFPAVPKANLIARLPAATKLPIAVKAPVAVQTAAVVGKPSPITPQKPGGKNSSGAPSLAASTDAAPPSTRMTIQGGRGSGSKDNASKDNSNNDGSTKAKKKTDYSDIINAYRRQEQSDADEGTSNDPYFQKGAFDRPQFQRDERLVAGYYNDQIGATDLLKEARKPGGGATAQDDEVPVAVTRGRIKDLAKIDAASQLAGLSGDEQEVIDAKDAIARGTVRDPKAIDRLVERVASKGVDKQYGEAPPVSVPDLVRKGDKLKKQGRHREAADLYHQAADAFKNGGRNSAEYRLGVVAEVQLGARPESDLGRVTNQGGGQTSTGKGKGNNNGSSTAQDHGSGSSGGQNNDGTHDGGGSSFGRPGDFGDRGDNGGSSDGSTGGSFDSSSRGGSRNSSDDSTTDNTDPTSGSGSAGDSASSSKGNGKASGVIDFSDVDPNAGENTEGDGYVDAEPAEDFYGPDGKRSSDDSSSADSSTDDDSDDETDGTAAPTSGNDDDSDDAATSIPAPDGEGRRNAKSDPGFMARAAAFLGAKKAGSPGNTDPVRGDGNVTFDRSMPIVDKKIGLIGNPGVAGGVHKPALITQPLPRVGNTSGNIDPDRNDTSTTGGGRKSGPLPPKPGGGV